MWKKSETDGTESESMGGAEKPVTVQGSASRRKEAATIGPSISIKGDLSGEEDLIVEGRVEGTIDLKQNNLTVGTEGRVSASVRANTISVEGEVEGDLSGDEQVVVRRSGNVQGNINAPRVTLEDGCKFRGSIDMDLSARPKAAANHPKAVPTIKPVASATTAESRNASAETDSKEKVSNS